jgi:hypothetical protein
MTTSGLPLLVTDMGFVLLGSTTRDRILISARVMRHHRILVIRRGVNPDAYLADTSG